MPSFLLPEKPNEPVSKPQLGFVSHAETSYPMFTPTPGNRYMSTPFQPVDPPGPKDSSEEVEIMAEEIEPRRLFQTPPETSKVDDDIHDKHDTL